MKRLLEHLNDEDRKKAEDQISKSFIDRTLQREKVWIKNAEKVFDKQESEVLAALKREVGEKIIAKDLTDDIFDVDKSVSTLIDIFTPIMAAQIAEEGGLSLDLLGLDQAFDERSKIVTGFINSQSKRMAKDVSEETSRMIRDTLSQGLADGETFGKLQERVEIVFANSKGYRSERIARSEVIRSSNFAQVEGWRQSEVVEGKEWLTALDEDVCPYCAPIGGTIIALDDTYLDKGDDYEGNGDRPLKINYENIEHPPLHPNCRCTLIPVIK